MLSDITFKYSAIAQVNMYERLNQFSKNHYRVTTMPLALSVILTDVFIDTLKVPIAALENLTFGAINLSTAPFFKNSNLKDASQNVKKAIGGVLVTPLALLISPLKLISQLGLVLSNFKEATSCNKDAFDEMKFNSIYTLSSDSEAKSLEVV